MKSAVWRVKVGAHHELRTASVTSLLWPRSGVPYMDGQVLATRSLQVHQEEARADSFLALLDGFRGDFEGSGKFAIYLIRRAE